MQTRSAPQYPLTSRSQVSTQIVGPPPAHMISAPKKRLLLSTRYRISYVSSIQVCTCSSGFVMLSAMLTHILLSCSSHVSLTFFNAVIFLLLLSYLIPDQVTCQPGSRCLELDHFWAGPPLCPDWLVACGLWLVASCSSRWSWSTISYSQPSGRPVTSVTQPP